MKTLFTSLAFAACLCAVDAEALTLTLSGAELTVEYDEPTTNTDLTPLDDLAYTNVYSKVGTIAEVKHPNVPASRAAGGGHIVTKITVPVPAGTRTDVTVTVTATDSAEVPNESARSIPVTKRIDRLAPSAPR